jgi:hypothetical protein
VEGEEEEDVEDDDDEEEEEEEEEENEKGNDDSLSKDEANNIDNIEIKEKKNMSRVEDVKHAIEVSTQKILTQEDFEKIRLRQLEKRVSYKNSAKLSGKRKEPESDSEGENSDEEKYSDFNMNLREIQKSQINLNKI